MTPRSTALTTLAVLAAATAVAGPVKSGIDVLAEHGFRELQGRRVGLITNHSGLDAAGRRTIDRIAEAPGVRLLAIFSPEHGLTGRADEPVASTRDAATGLPVHSLYGETRRLTPAMLEGVDTLVYDVADVGARFYTYIATLGYAIEEAAKRDLEVVVLDRPNPIGGEVVEGPVSDAGLTGDFIAYFPMPARYGMTIGELAAMFTAERKLGARLRVVAMEGWRRAMWFDETGLRWIDPSPALRRLSATALYPATNMLYITDGRPPISMGRGSDAPYEVFGAPWVRDERALASYLNERRIPGVSFVPLRFTPRESVFVGEECGGVFVVLLDRQKLNTGRLGAELLSAFWRLHPGRFGIDGVYRRVGSKAVLEAIKAGADPLEVEALWQKDLAAFKATRAKYLLYP
jgi:uncharacterized protein YbbC (DUF1343 family)